MNYLIGGHIISVIGDEAYLADTIPSFDPFIISEEEAKGGPCLMRLTLVDDLQRVMPPDCRFILEADTGNGIITVERLLDGRYQFVIHNVENDACALLITTPEFQHCECSLLCGKEYERFALNNTLMLAYAFSSAYRDTILIHASVVRHAGYAVAFTAKSGTGKSTQVANWLRAIPDCDIMNDDNPILRFIDGVPTIFGSPWSGKTPCYRSVSAPLKAVVLIKRDSHNEMRPQMPITAFTTLLSACSSMKWDEELYPRICNTVSQFVEKIKIASLHCLPDPDSAVTCCRYLFDE